MLYSIYTSATLLTQVGLLMLTDSLATIDDETDMINLFPAGCEMTAMIDPSPVQSELTAVVGYYVARFENAWGFSLASFYDDLDLKADDFDDLCLALGDIFMSVRGHGVSLEDRHFDLSKLSARANGNLKRVLQPFYDELNDFDYLASLWLERSGYDADAIHEDALGAMFDEGSSTWATNYITL